MNEFLVLVPTTQKLVGITDIVEENKGVLPVVCVTNELKSLMNIKILFKIQQVL